MTSLDGFKPDVECVHAFGMAVLSAALLMTSDRDTTATTSSPSSCGSTDFRRTASSRSRYNSPGRLPAAHNVPSSTSPWNRSVSRSIGSEGRYVKLTNDNSLQKRTRLQALHWRAIRSASTQHLRFFSEIGAGDLEKLEQLVDEERRKRDDAEEAPAAQDEGYDSDSSVLGLTERPEPAAESAQAGEEETKEGETGTVVEGGMGEEAGTPPPPPATPSAALQDQPEETDQVIDDEPGTPPPKAVVASPGTPKRPREEGPEDVAMQEGESAKRAKVE